MVLASPGRHIRAVVWGLGYFGCICQFFNQSKIFIAENNHSSGETFQAYFSPVVICLLVFFHSKYHCKERNYSILVLREIKDN